MWERDNSAGGRGWATLSLHNSSDLVRNFVQDREAYQIHVGIKPTEDDRIVNTQPTINTKPEPEPAVIKTEPNTTEDDSTEDDWIQTLDKVITEEAKPTTTELAGPACQATPASSEVASSETTSSRLTRENGRPR